MIEPDGYKVEIVVEANGPSVLLLESSGNLRASHQKDELLKRSKLSKMQG